MGYEVSCPKGDFFQKERFQVKAMKHARQHSKKTGHTNVLVQRTTERIPPWYNQQRKAMKELKNDSHVKLEKKIE